jgi:enoyl-CoA hydratase/carnithine racemase
VTRQDRVVRLEHVRLQVGDPVVRLTLARPDRRNALSLGVLREIRDALRHAALHRTTSRVVVIDAEGPSFSAGHDLREMVDRRDEARYYDELFAACAETMATIREIPQPVIAQVHGTATAAGCQLVAACDLAVATDDARFATPGVGIGLFCSMPMVPLSRAVGRKRALEMLLTGEPIDAATAADWGLVNRIVPPDRLAAEVAALAERVCAASRPVVGLGKRAFYVQEGLTEADAYTLTRDVMVGNAALDDALEGMSAFLERRTPEWRDR